MPGSEFSKRLFWLVGVHYLVEEKTPSLEDFQNDVVDMSSARLVTLSACETGITDITTGSADEFVCLLQALLLAGVPCVVSSLLSVPDISTAILVYGSISIISFWEWIFPKLCRMLSFELEILLPSMWRSISKSATAQAIGKVKVKNS